MFSDFIAIVAFNNAWYLIFSAPGPGVPVLDGQWVDGLNTFVEDRQGVAHIKKYENVFPPITTALPVETTAPDSLLEK